MRWQAVIGRRHRQNGIQTGQTSLWYLRGRRWLVADDCHSQRVWGSLVAVCRREAGWQLCREQRRLSPWLSSLVVRSRMYLSSRLPAPLRPEVLWRSVLGSIWHRPTCIQIHVLNTSSSADAEVARHASRWMLPKWESTYPAIVFVSRIQDHMILRSRSASTCM